MPDKDAWVIRDVDEETRRKIKRFAVDNGMTIAAALKVLVELALTNLEKTGMMVVPISRAHAQESIERASSVQLSSELLDAMREEIRRQLKKQESE